MPLSAVRFTNHARKRMNTRNISEDDIRHVLNTGEVIEDYPNTAPYPSYLILGWSDGRPIHVVATDHLALQASLVITVYQPDPNEWDPSFKVRVQ